MVTKAKAKKFSWRKPFYVTVAIIGMLLLTFQIRLDVHLWRATQYPSGEPIANMIIQSIRSVNKPAVIEPVSKKVYLPDASLVLPPQPQDLSDVEYSYLPSIDGADAEASVTLTNAVSVGISKILNAESIGLQQHDPGRLFQAVPNAQICARGVHVVFGSKAKYANLHFIKTLADGRVMKVYTEQQACEFDLQPLVTYLRDAQSY
jgi:hypothetical protein